MRKFLGVSKSHERGKWKQHGASSSSLLPGGMQRPHFTRAAKRCNVSQPSLTRAIQMLEKEFGGYLFDRKRSSNGLTHLGKLFCPYLEEVWRTAFLAKRSARGYSAKIPKKVNLPICVTDAAKPPLQTPGR